MSSMSRNIDRSSSTPLYKQIMDILLEDMEEGDKIPTEHELRERFAVSRMTVRQAIQTLIREGSLIRYRGKGTFVAPERVQHDLHTAELLSLFEDLSQSGNTLHSQVLRRKLVPAPCQLVSRVKELEGREVVELIRVRTLNDRPLVYQVSYWPERFYPLISEVDITEHSLVKAIEDNLHIRAHRADFSVRAISADEMVAGHLGVGEGDPLLRIEKLSFRENQEWFELALLYCAPEVFELTFSTEASPKKNQNPS